MTDYEHTLTNTGTTIVTDKGRRNASMEAVRRLYMKMRKQGARWARVRGLGDVHRADLVDAIRLAGGLCCVEVVRSA